MGVITAEKIIFSMRHRVIVPADAGIGNAGIGNAGIGNGDIGAVAARQVDAVLMSAGFKCSAELLTALGSLEPGAVTDLGVQVIGWARELAGDHVRHNVYFIDFPRNVRTPAASSSTRRSRRSRSRCPERRHRPGCTSTHAGR